MLYLLSKTGQNHSKNRFYITLRYTCIIIQSNAAAALHYNQNISLVWLQQKTSFITGLLVISLSACGNGETVQNYFKDHQPSLFKIDAQHYVLETFFVSISKGVM